jgi:hypothetical protein
LNELHNVKDDLKQQIDTLESRISSLDEQRKKLFYELRDETTKYSLILLKTIERLESQYKDELDYVRRQYLSAIKPYHIDFSKYDPNEISSRELIRRLSDLTAIRKNFKQREIAMIEETMKREHKKVTDQHAIIKSLNDDYRTVADNYQKLNLEKFNLLNKFLSFEKVEEIYKNKKADILDRKIEKYFLELPDKIDKQIRPWIRKLLEDNIHAILKFHEDSIKPDQLTLINNRKFVSDLYKAKNAEILFTIKYLNILQGETFIVDVKEPKNKQNIYSSLVSKSLQKLYALSHIFEDNFARTLFENSKLTDVKTFNTNNDLLSDFKVLQNELFFDLLAGLKNHHYSIVSFLLFKVMSSGTNFWLSLYNPLFNQINGNESELIKGIKAMTFIRYYLHRGKNADAFYYLQYLNHKSPLLKEFKNKLEVSAKNELVLDLLENHYT